jgi:hypothetical protein
MPTDHLIRSNNFRSRLNLNLKLDRACLFCYSIVIDSITYANDRIYWTNIDLDNFRSIVLIWIDRVRLCLIVMFSSIAFKIRSFSYFLVEIAGIVIARWRSLPIRKSLVQLLQQLLLKKYFVSTN